MCPVKQPLRAGAERRASEQEQVEIAVVVKGGQQDLHAPAARERGHVDPRQSTAVVAPVPAVGRLHDVGPAVAGDIADHLISVVAGRWPQLCPCHVRHHTAFVDYLEVAASRSEEHTSELQSLMRISYAVFCLKQKKPT